MKKSSLFFVSSFCKLLFSFKKCFTVQTFETFCILVFGWLLCHGRHTITGVIRAVGAVGYKHHSSFHNFFSKLKWDPDELGKVVLEIALKLIKDILIIVTVDDTLAKKTGPHIWGAGDYIDHCRSTRYSKNGGKGKKVFAHGHNWVVLCLGIPLPWNQEKIITIPIMSRLYIGKKNVSPDKYKKRTTLALEMLEKLATWLNPIYQVLVLGDNEYSCKTILKNLPKNFYFDGRMPMDAALYKPAPEKYTGMGRPRKKGKRLPNPKEILDDPSYPWKEETLKIGRKEVTVFIKTLKALWYNSAGEVLLNITIVRDSRGIWKDGAYFSTLPSLSGKEIPVEHNYRWGEEVVFRNGKQLQGWEDPQNGWYKKEKKKKKKRKKKQPGSRPHKKKGEKAVRRTFPFALLCYSIVTLWYLLNVDIKKTMERQRKLAPWYTHKVEISFEDILQEFRLQYWTERLFKNPTIRGDFEKVIDELPFWLYMAA